MEDFPMSEPRYAAYVAGALVEAGDRLSELLPVVRKLAAGNGEDVAIWRAGRLAGILLANGNFVYHLGGQRQADALEAAVGVPDAFLTAQGVAGLFGLDRGQVAQRLASVTPA